MRQSLVGGSMRAASAAWWLAMIAWTARTEPFAQTIRMDATPGHVVNTFSPLYALGATVDRVPSNATDTFFARIKLSKS